MSELRDRLERLAARGTRRGADDVLDAAMLGVPRDAGATDHDGAEHTADDDVPFVMVEPDAHNRGRFGTLVGAVGVAALVGVGALAISAVFGSGGASSPEGAVRQLADAITHKDPLAAVDVLVPSEVRSMRETVKAATKRAADLQVVNDASQPLAGVDLSVDHLELSTQPLADGFTKVTITSGEISAKTHEAAMSKLLQDVQHDSKSEDREGRANLARLASSSDLPTFVVTVRHDGGWYVSPAYTALEYAREAAGGPAADYGSAKAAELGADTPEHAVSDALRAWQAANWDRLMALAPPDELPVYDFRAWIDKEAVDTHPDFSIDKLDTSATVNGDTAIVKLNASGTSGSGSDQGTWQVGGTCPASPYGMYGSSASASSSGEVVTGPYFGTSSRTGSDTIVSGGSDGGGDVNGPSELCLSGDLSGAVPFGLLAFPDGSSAPESGPISIEAVREGGRWFVSPVSTVLDAVDATIERIDKRSIYTLLGLAYELPPDGAITLDQPFKVPASNGYFSASVFSFDGTKGQNIVGEISGGNSYGFGDLYTAAGHEVDGVNFSTVVKIGAAYTVTLPESGSYRLVVTEPVRSGSTLTLWDAKDAPKGLVGQIDGEINGDCTSTPTSQSCTSTSTPIKVPGAPGNLSSSCVVGAKAVACPGAPPIPLCETVGSSNNTDCLPRSVAEEVYGSSSSSSTYPPSATAPVAPKAKIATATTAVTATTGVAATTGP